MLVVNYPLLPQKLNEMSGLIVVLSLYLCHIIEAYHKISMVSPNTLQTAVQFSNVGAAGLDWPNLGFSYLQTDSFVYTKYQNDQWDDIQSKSDPYLPIHIGATALHYGQACFEGKDIIFVHQ